MQLPKNSLELAKEVIMLLSDRPGVSGYEYPLDTLIRDIYSTYGVDITSDYIGNYYIRKNGEDSKQTVMLAAHLDEIGLMITHIDSRGFLHFSTVGGIDQRTLVNQEVIVHGSQELKGIISPVFAENRIDRKKTYRINDLIIDTGYPLEQVREIVKPGDIISMCQSPLVLLNNRISGKALDDRAGIAVLAVCINELTRLRHKHNVTVVATVQEEVGLRGAVTSSETLLPELAIAIDVTHAQTLDTKSQVSINLGKGPVITLGPNIHPFISSEMQRIGNENRLTYQIQPISGPTGTDARVIQLAGHGIPTGLISIPLRYMHTTVETASLQDIADCGLLLAYFIANLPNDLEELA